MTAEPLRIEVKGGTAVAITWDDDTHTDLTAHQLREACMCAGCREDSGARKTAAILAGDEPVTILEAELVGGYALKFIFGPDGHGTGIFPFDTLRTMDGS